MLPAGPRAQRRPLCRLREAKYGEPPSDVPKGPGPAKPDDYCPERLSKRCVDLGFYGVLA